MTPTASLRSSSIRHQPVDSPVTKVFVRHRQNRTSKVVVAILFLLIAFMMTAFSMSAFTYWYAGLLVLFSVSQLFAGLRVEVDLVNKRYRTYWFRMFAKEADFVQLPTDVHIHVRDIAYAGGRADSSAGSWGDTYAYELSIMSDARNKLVLTIRPNKATIVSMVDLLRTEMKLPVKDATQDRILTDGA